MTSTVKNAKSDGASEEIEQASRASMASILNLTFLPGVAFLWLLLKWHQAGYQGVGLYHLRFAIKLNLQALFCLVVVTALMLFLGGFNSPWTWVFVITYFTTVHTVFILGAMWAMTRAWSGKRILADSKYN